MENERRPQQKTPASRYALLDELRGLDLVSMMLYHACWDMMFLFGIWMDWYIGWPGRLWQQTICWVFILLSGFCVPLGTRHPEARRTGVCCRGTGHGGDAGVHAGGPGGVRCADLSGQRHAAHRCAGTAAEKMIPPAAGLAVSAVLFALTYHLDERWLGFGMRLACRMHVRELLYSVFRLSALRFLFHRLFCPAAVLFLFWAGYFLYGIVGRQRMEPLRRSVCPALGWMGRHSLLLYLLHQPVIYGVLSAAAVLFCIKA